jgi:hypothetical protein
MTRRSPPRSATRAKRPPEKYAELETDKQYITEFERDGQRAPGEKRNLRRDDIVKEIMGMVEAHAKAGGYTMVLDTSGKAPTWCRWCFIPTARTT